MSTTIQEWLVFGLMLGAGIMLYIEINKDKWW